MKYPYATNQQTIIQTKWSMMKTESKGYVPKFKIVKQNLLIV